MKYNSSNVARFLFFGYILVKKSKKRFIFTDQVSEIIEKIDQDALKIQSMLNSKYAYIIKEDLDLWEGKLNIF